MEELGTKLPKEADLQDRQKYSLNISNKIKEIKKEISIFMPSRLEKTKNRHQKFQNRMEGSVNYLVKAMKKYKILGNTFDFTQCANYRKQLEAFTKKVNELKKPMQSLSDQLNKIDLENIDIDEMTTIVDHITKNYINFHSGLVDAFYDELLYPVGSQSNPVGSHSEKFMQCVNNRRDNYRSLKNEEERQQRVKMDLLRAVVPYEASGSGAFSFSPQSSSSADALVDGMILGHIFGGIFDD